MNDMNSQELLELVSKGYEIDMTGLAFIARQGVFPEMQSALEDYRSFIKNRFERGDNKYLLSAVMSEPGVISALSGSPLLREIFLIAHLACCCELLNGWEFNTDMIQDPDLYKAVNERIQTEINNNPKLVYDYTRRLNNADTLRTIQILRLLGLLDFSSRSCRQLSLCAGFGRKDIYAVHATPVMHRNQPNVITAGSSNISFSINHGSPEQITLIDNDKSLEELYKNYNSESNGQIYAINDDASDALDLLPELIRKKKLEPYNLVLGIRIDHRMVDNIPRFFKQLASVSSPETSLVISIGAGYSVAEFEGRVSLIGNMFNYLKDKDLEPTKIVLHTGETVKEGREKPAFGYVAIATHMILHCKLHRDKLI